MSVFRKSKNFRALWILQEGKCFYCGFEMVKATYHRKGQPHGYTRDHFLPYSAGHTNGGNNVLSCHTCNNDKGDAAPSYEECVAFVTLWQRLIEIQPHAHMNAIWHEFIEDLEFIRSFNRLVGMPCSF